MLISKSQKYTISFSGDINLLFAAEELQHYLSAAIETDFELVRGSESADFQLALLHDVEEAQLQVLGVDDDFLSQDSGEGYVIRTHDKQICFYGNRPRAVLYAVYDFIRNELGCEFAMPKNRIEAIPELTSLDIPVTNRIEKAVFPVRGFGFHTDTCTDVDFYIDFIDWLAKLRYNRIQINIRLWEKMADKLAPAIEARDLDLDLGIHCMNFFLPESRYYSDHPEWYTDKENRFGRQLRFTCLDSVQEMTQEVIAFLDKYPCIKYLGLWPLDGTDFDAEEINSGKIGDCILEYINSVANFLADRYPDLIIDHLAYVGYVAPPEKAVPASNVMASVCHYWDRNFTQPIHDAWYGRERFAYRSSKERAKNKFHPLRNHQQCCEDLCGWIERGPAIVFSYYPDLNLNGHCVFDITDVIQQDMKYYHAIGAKGSLACYCMHDEFLWFYRDVHTLAETLWNPDVELTQIHGKLLDAVFDEAANDMKFFYEALDQLHNKPLMAGFRLADLLSRGIIPAYELAGYYGPIHDMTLKQIDDKFKQVEDILDTALKSTGNLVAVARIKHIQFNLEMQKTFAHLGCRVLMAFAIRKQAALGKITQETADKRAVEMCADATSILESFVAEYEGKYPFSPGFNRRINSYRSALKNDFPTMLPS